MNEIISERRGGALEKYTKNLGGDIGKDENEEDIGNWYNSVTGVRRLVGYGLESERRYDCQHFT
ncbi:MAG: hypothetical protein N2V76_00690 [Methanophagales archaeon]|nr:hypothetical protein [Methanophagales archaeon]